jgi:hypothetical protein
MSTESDDRARRKPPTPVKTIDGKSLPDDRLTDDDYQEAIDAQDAVLFAQGVERKILGRIRSRLVSRLVLGARDAGVKYYFDENRGIVRRREKEGTGT